MKHVWLMLWLVPALAIAEPAAPAEVLDATPPLPAATSPAAPRPLVPAKLAVSVAAE